MNFLLVASSSSFLVAACITKKFPILLLWITSSLNHGGIKNIHQLDKTLAHSICAYSIYKCPLVFNIYTVGYWLSCVYAILVFQIYKLSYIPGIYGDIWHASFHIITSYGMILHNLADPKQVAWIQFIVLNIGCYLLLL
jgi:hypothetical protein